MPLVDDHVLKASARIRLFCCKVVVVRRHDIGMSLTKLISLYLAINFDIVLWVILNVLATSYFNELSCSIPIARDIFACQNTSWFTKQTLTLRRNTCGFDLDFLTLFGVVKGWLKTIWPLGWGFILKSILGVRLKL